jgi:hypothetical protein
MTVLDTPSAGVYEAIDVELDHSGQGMHVVPTHHIEVEGDLSAPMSADDARAGVCALLRAADILDGETRRVTDLEKAGDELIADMARTLRSYGSLRWVESRLDLPEGSSETAVRERVKAATAPMADETHDAPRSPSGGGAPVRLGPRICGVAVVKSPGPAR